MDARLIPNTDVTSLWDCSPLGTESLLSTIAIRTICTYVTYVRTYTLWHPSFVLSIQMLSSPCNINSVCRTHAVLFHLLCGNFTQCVSILCLKPLSWYFPFQLLTSLMFNCCLWQCFHLTCLNMDIVSPQSNSISFIEFTSSYIPSFMSVTSRSKVTIIGWGTSTHQKFRRSKSYRYWIPV